jgi:heptosyltransferase-2
MKILVRAPNWVGDAVMAIPAIEALRGHWPEAELVILARPGVAELYQGQPFADRLVVFESAGKHSGVLGRERLARELRAEGFELAVLLQNAFDAAWIAWRAGIPKRVGYARDARSLLLTQAIGVPRADRIPPHESYYYLELLRRAGWLKELPRVDRTALRVDTAARGRAEETLLRAGARRGAHRIAIAPGAQFGSAKCWPPDRFAEVADRLAEETDADVIVFGTAVEKGIAERIAAKMQLRPMILAGITKLADLPALLAVCHLFIGNDSGAMHVAAAVGLPVVAIFGPTDPSATAAATEQLELVRHPISCSPCFLRACPVDHRCMTRIRASDVSEAARKLMTRAELARKRIGSRG